MFNQKLLKFVIFHSSIRCRFSDPNFARYFMKNYKNSPQGLKKGSFLFSLSIFFFTMILYRYWKRIWCHRTRAIEKRGVNSSSVAYQIYDHNERVKGTLLYTISRKQMIKLTTGIKKKKKKKKKKKLSKLGIVKVKLL